MPFFLVLQKSWRNGSIIDQHLSPFWVEVWQFVKSSCWAWEILIFSQEYISHTSWLLACKNLVKNGCLLIMKVVWNHQEGSTAIIRFSVRVIFWTCSNLAVVNKLHWIHNTEKNETRQTGKQTAEFFKEFFALISLVHFATGKNLQRSSVKNIFLYLHTVVDFTENMAIFRDKIDESFLRFLGFSI